MLTHLSIRDFAIVPALELEFDQGFTAITGETGAGKSILVGALGLLLGERSDSGWVRPGSEKAELSAVFDLAGNGEALDWLGQAELGSGQDCLLRRTISANGRSRAWVNGTPVTLQQLGELGNLLVELHGQNEHIRLASRRRQLQLLDASGSYTGELEACAQCYRAWKSLDEQLTALLDDAPASPGELELLRFQVSELQQQALSAEDLASLESEHRLLSKGGELLEAIHASLDRLESEDLGVGSGLHSALNALEVFEALDSNIAEARRMLQEAAINCQEAAASLRAAGSRVDLDPDRLQSVGDQLGALGDLARKHRVQLEQLGEVRDTLAGRLDRAEHFSGRRDELEAECSAALASYRQAAKRLSECREKHATSLGQAVSALMAELGMPGGTFRIQLRHDAGGRPRERGDDDVELLVSANPGMPPGPLAKIASGGELSRISLAIKTATSRAGAALTQVFDEVDAGIGGATANAVGGLLRRLADGGQALCVTHLAQVAVCAAHQIAVRKDAADETTRLDTLLLDGDGRVDEVARMLSGRVSDQSRAHASALLEAARAEGWPPPR
jgi:DNA repair protein RecN (Recombination protein N)